MRRTLLFSLIVVLFSLLTSRAHAQVHWDGAVEAGGMKRIVTSRPPGGHDVGFGPMVGLRAHLALMPLLRVGAYFDGDLSPSDEPAARRVYSGGLRLKITPPVTFGPDEAMRTWLFLGFGYAGVYAPSYRTQLQIQNPAGPTVSQDVNAGGAGGHFLEIPFGIGVGWRLRKPWEVSAELSGRLGIANSGTVYNSDGRPASVVGGSPIGVDTRIDTPGQDSWAFGLTIGIGLDL